MTNNPDSQSRILGEGDLGKIASELEGRRKECEDEGEHKSIMWFPYAISGNSNPLKDKVRGICNYCLTHLERPLNSQEIEELRNFYKMLQESVTI